MPTQMVLNRERANKDSSPGFERRVSLLQPKQSAPCKNVSCQETSAIAACSK